MIHRHWPLRDGVQREGTAVDGRLLERHVPERQRVEICSHALAMLLGRLDLAVALGGEAEFLQRFRVQLQDHLHRGRSE